MPNLWFEQGRGQRRPQHHAHLLAGVLIDRNVDVGNAIDVETVILDILNNTHDGVHGLVGSAPNRTWRPSGSRVGQYLRAVLSSMMATGGLPSSSPSVNERPRRSVDCNTLK